MLFSRFNIKSRGTAAPACQSCGTASVQQALCLHSRPLCSRSIPVIPVKTAKFLKIKILRGGKKKKKRKNKRGGEENKGGGKKKKSWTMNEPFLDFLFT